MGFVWFEGKQDGVYEIYIESLSKWQNASVQGFLKGIKIDEPFFRLRSFKLID